MTLTLRWCAVASLLIRRNTPVATPFLAQVSCLALMQLTGTTNGSILNPTVTAEPLVAFRPSVAPAMEFTQEQ